MQAGFDPPFVPPVIPAGDFGYEDFLWPGAKSGSLPELVNNRF